MTWEIVLSDKTQGVFAASCVCGAGMDAMAASGRPGGRARRTLLTQCRYRAAETCLNGIFPAF